ncbi:unnamed protein product [Parajaminaea phylloscopi]
MADSSGTMRELPAYEGTLLIPLAGRWEERWCAIIGNRLLVYRSKLAAVFEPHNAATSYDLSTFAALQTSGSWGASVGPFELSLSRRQPEADGESSSSAASASSSDRFRKVHVQQSNSSLPRALTSGSLHSLYERCATPSSLRRPFSPVREGHDESCTSPVRLHSGSPLSQDASWSSPPPDRPAPASLPSSQSKFGSWLRLPGRSRASNALKSSSKSGGGSDRFLGDRYRREAASAAEPSVANDVRSAPLVLRAESAAAMTRWAEIISPWLGNAPHSPEPAAAASTSSSYSSPLRSKSSTWTLLQEDFEPRARSSPLAHDSERPRINPQRSITDLMEDAGNNARRRRTESIGEAGRGDVASRRAAIFGAGAVKEDAVAAETAPNRRLRRTEAEGHTHRLSLISASDFSRPSTASAMSLRSLSSKRRSSMSQSEKRLSGQSSRRSSSPMNILTLWQAHFTRDGSSLDPTTSSNTSGPAHEGGSLEEIMGNERRSAAHRFAELRRNVVLAPDATDEASRPKLSSHRIRRLARPSTAHSARSPETDACTSSLSTASPAMSVGPGLESWVSSDCSSPAGPLTPRSPTTVLPGLPPHASLTGRVSPSKGRSASSGEKQTTGMTVSASLPVLATILHSSKQSPERARIASPEKGKIANMRFVKRLGKGRNAAAKVALRSASAKPSRIDEDTPESDPAPWTYRANVGEPADLAGPASPTMSLGDGAFDGRPCNLDTNPRYIERILPPELIVSQMDAISKLEPDAAAEARRGLVAQWDLQAPSAMTSSRSNVTNLASESRSLDAASGLTRSQTTDTLALGLGISLDGHSEMQPFGAKRPDAVRQRPQTAARSELYPRERSSSRCSTSTGPLDVSAVSTKGRPGLSAPPRVARKRSQPLALQDMWDVNALRHQPSCADAVIQDPETAFPSPPRARGKTVGALSKRSAWRRHSTFDAVTLASSSSSKGGSFGGPQSQSSRRGSVADKENDEGAFVEYSRRASIQSNRTSRSTSMRRSSLLPPAGRISGTTFGRYADLAAGSGAAPSAWRSSFATHFPEPAPALSTRPLSFHRPLSHASASHSLKSLVTTDDGDHDDGDGDGDGDSNYTGGDSSVYEAQIYAVTARLRAVRTSPTPTAQL